MKRKDKLAAHKARSHSSTLYGVEGDWVLSARAALGSVRFVTTARADVESMVGFRATGGSLPPCPELFPRLGKKSNSNLL